ncbi:MAG: DUF2283 domain-containing protein [Planctomycetota bacterium]
MKGRYLEVTYRKGKPLAAYFYLPRADGDTVASSEPTSGDMVIDRNASGKPIGIEVLSPATLTLAALNHVLHQLAQPAAIPADLTPLPTAA